MQNKFDDSDDVKTRIEQNNASATGGTASLDASSAAFHSSVARTGKSTNAFKTISEVADELGVQQHVLRFWETKFSQVRPLKRGGGRRYYRPEDVQLLHAIHNLLYTEGYTIKGVQKLLRDMGKKKVLDGIEVVPAAGAAPAQAQQPVAKAPQIAPTITPAQSVVNPQEQLAQGQNRSMTKSQREALDGLLNELKEIRGLIKS